MSGLHCDPKSEVITIYIILETAIVDIFLYIKSNHCPHNRLLLDRKNVLFFLYLLGGAALS